MLKFLNKFMKSGKKAVIEKLTFAAFKQIKKKTKRNTLYLFLTILLKFRPLLGFISKRFGKQFKKIPVPLYPRRQIIVSLKWLVTAIKVNRLSFFGLRLASEFLDFHLGKKTLLSKRYNDHLVEINENRLNHRFRWK
jgi:ribosomal protein S7